MPVAVDAQKQLPMGKKIRAMRWMLAGLIGLAGLSAFGLPNRMFYRCDSLLADYYADGQYDKLKSAWSSLPRETIPLSAYKIYLQIAVSNADTSLSEELVSLMVEKYGFDVVRERQYSLNLVDSARNVFLMERHYAKWDSLRFLWKQNNRTQEATGREIARFQEKERVVYPRYLKNPADPALKAGIDSLFEHLLYICHLQDALPNEESNGYGKDISIPLFHILSVSDSALQERWKRIFPFVERAFESGEISNSYFFLYDRLLFRQKGIQAFGGMGQDVPMIEGADYEQQKRRYLIDEAPVYLRINEEWKHFYGRE